MDLTTIISNELVTKLDLPNFKAGDNVTVYYKIKEGEKERIQFFKGDVIQRKGSGSTETFTIRKISNGIAVERIFPVNSPSIDKIEVNKIGPNYLNKHFNKDLIKPLANNKKKNKKDTED